MSEISFIGYLPMLLGVCGIGYALLVIRRKASRVEEWPGVQGKIVLSEVKTCVSKQGGFSDNVSKFKNFEASVKYTYEVDGRRFVGSEINPGGQLATYMSERAQSKAATYHKGAEVLVFYNPDNPQEAYLEKNEETSLLVIGASSVFIVVGLMFLILA
ncbi:MAG: DUF3592 domain-containing protein [Gammaproteobacteria bacterium]